MTCLFPDFVENMLSEAVLKVDVCRYLEENWPLDDEDTCIEKIHKLYRLVAYQRCRAGFFRFWTRRGDHFHLVCTPKYEKGLRQQMVSILISNMPRRGKGM